MPGLGAVTGPLSAGSAGAKPGPLGAATVPPTPFATADGGYVTVVSDGLHNAFPGMAQLADGTLILVYRRSTNHSPSKGEIYKRTSTDLGLTWSAATLVYSDATLDARDPQLALLSDGRLAMNFFLSSPTTPGDPVTDGVRVAFSSDGGATWGAPVSIAHGFTLWGSCSARIVEYQGALLLGLQGRNTGDTFSSVTVTRSTDNGATWTPRSSVVVNGQTATRNVSEPNLVVAGDGSLVLAIRDSSNKIIEIHRSTTDWQTYGAINASFAGDGSPRMRKLASGTIFLTTRDAVNGLAIFTYSTDNGVTWAAQRELDSGISSTYLQMTYASMIEVAPGIVLAVMGDENTTQTVSDIFARYIFERPGIAPSGAVATPKGIVGRALMCHVTHSANQSVTSGITLTLAFDTERYDRGAFHNKVTNNSRLVAPVDGIYRIRGLVEFASGAGTYRQLTIRRGGSANIAVKNQSPVSGLSTRADIETDYQLGAGDYVELQAAQDSGGALNVLATASYSPEFMMTLIGPA